MAADNVGPGSMNPGLEYPALSAEAPQQVSVPILLVDDNIAKRLALRSVLMCLGHTIIEAESGVAALRCVMAQDFAVILLDVHMPIMDGFETARRIRERRQSELTPIIFITAFASDEIAAPDLYPHGAVDFLYAPVPPNELRAKVSAFAHLFVHTQGLVRRAADAQTAADRLHLENHELAALARNDPLTGLGNRRALEDDLIVLQARAVRYGHRYCLAMLDIDQFKSYNDAYGHAAGDWAIRTVATQLQAGARGGDRVYRYGGDEFTLILPEQSLETATMALQRLRATIDGLAIPHAANLRGIVTLSAGLAILNADGTESAADVLREADRALYRAKHLGRDQLQQTPVTGDD